MNESQPANIMGRPAQAKAEQEQPEERTAERSGAEPTATGPATATRWNRAFQDCPWDEDPECICAENTMQQPGRSMSKDEPDI